METPQPTLPVSGRSLELERRALGIQVQELAQAMGVQSSTISRIENSFRVTVTAERRYRAALATFTTVPTAES